MTLYSESERIEHDEITRERLPGITYLDWLQWFHNKLRPSNYVEIGVESGQSIQFAKDPTLCVGIDPAPQIVYSIDVWTKIFKLTSDDFFDTEDINSIVKGPIEMSFIDGLHYYDNVLKDFINVEKNARPNSVVLLHDVYPVVPVTATRERTTFYWAGDTWKIIPILEQYRPDLTLRIIPAYPTGLAFITDLDPTNTVLSDNFSVIVEEFAMKDFDKYTPNNMVENKFNEIETLLKV